MCVCVCVCVWLVGRSLQREPGGQRSCGASVWHQAASTCGTNEARYSKMWGTCVLERLLDVDLGGKGQDESGPAREAGKGQSRNRFLRCTARVCASVHGGRQQRRRLFVTRSRRDATTGQRPAVSIPPALTCSLRRSGYRQRRRRRTQYEGEGRPC